jgi:hypothetical protein
MVWEGRKNVPEMLVSGYWLWCWAEFGFALLKKRGPQIFFFPSFDKGLEKEPVDGLILGELLT